MKFFDKQISEFEAEIQSKEKVVFPFSDNMWEDVGRNEIVMQKESAYELQGTGFELFTSKKIGADEVIVIGDDLRKIKGNVSFARVSLVELDDIQDEQSAHDTVRKVEYIKYHYFPKGYMVRTNSLSSQENVRVSKKAIKDKISFEAVGNLLISKYKENSAVKAVKVFFITDKTVNFSSLKAIAEKSSEITEALDHVIRDLNLDCNVCKLKAICDEVEGMKELHFKNAMQ
ncbi:MAG: hypothetical protein J1F24_05550 [Oscillospiraceae bacterium]|nr:hypothetical protein [Oscillospiraceae bacterium]